MPTEIVVENPSDARRDFWLRQFENPPSKAQIIFDVIFGIAMPVLCFIADLGILRGSGLLGLGDLSFGQYSVWIYGLSAIAIPTLAVWLSAGRRIRAAAGVFSGILMAGAICSFLIWFLILLITMIGFVVGIGVVLTPLVSGFVYLRNAVRSFNQSRLNTTTSRSVRLLISACALTVALPAMANWQASRIVTRSIEQILGGDDASIEDAAHRLRYLNWYDDLDRIAFAYQRETDPSRKERLAKAYKTVTGDDVESRLRRLRD